MQKVPYMAVIGQREAESDSLALRVRGAGKKQEVMAVDAFLEPDRRGGAEPGAGAVACHPSEHLVCHSSSCVDSRLSCSRFVP